MTIGLKAKHHYKRITKEVKEDMQTWLAFLDGFNGKSILVDNRIWSDTELQLFTDASGKIGFGGFLQNSWFQGIW